MMIVFLITFSIFLLAMLGLSLGWIFNQKTIKGSCGGLSAIPGAAPSNCSCSKPCEKRLKRMAEEQQNQEPNPAPLTQHTINRLD